MQLAGRSLIELFCPALSNTSSASTILVCCLLNTNQRLGMPPTQHFPFLRCLRGSFKAPSPVFMRIRLSFPSFSKVMPNCTGCKYECQVINCSKCLLEMPNLTAILLASISSQRAPETMNLSYA